MMNYFFPDRSSVFKHDYDTMHTALGLTELVDEYK